jgi:proline iminopeptidase
MSRIQRRQFVTASARASLAAACGYSQASAAPGLVLPTDGQVRTGGSRLIEIGGGHRVWTKKVGDAPIKVLLLHGGPGANHCYFECFEDFLPRNGIEFYYHDQLDSGYSDKPGDPTLWTIERFRDEVEAVRKGLGLDQFYLLGHSWGGMLAIEYALAYPRYLKGLIISDMAAGIKAVEKYLAVLRAELPKDVIAVLDKYEKAGNYEAPEYQKTIVEQFYNRHICRLNPWPEPLSRSLGDLNQKLYNYLQGPNEMFVTGAMRTWERWADLHRISTRTLVMGAKYDEMAPSDLQKMATLMPNARAWISTKGSHMSMYDDQVPYFHELLTFLKSS